PDPAVPAGLLRIPALQQPPPLNLRERPPTHATSSPALHSTFFSSHPGNSHLSAAPVSSLGDGTARKGRPSGPVTAQELQNEPSPLGDLCRRGCCHRRGTSRKPNPPRRRAGGSGPEAMTFHRGSSNGGR